MRRISTLLAATNAGLDPGAVRSGARRVDAAHPNVARQQARDADPVVAGKYGRSSVDGPPPGGVAERVPAQSRCAVLVATRPTN